MWPANVGNTGTCGVHAVWRQRLSGLLRGGRRVAVDLFLKKSATKKNEMTLFGHHHHKHEGKNQAATAQPGKEMAEHHGTHVKFSEPSATTPGKAPLSPTKVQFEVKSGEEGGMPTRVELVGDFSGWKEPVEMQRVSGSARSWSAVVPMTTGEHAIKFLVDGCWTLSEELPTCTDSDGNVNNMVKAT